MALLVVSLTFFLAIFVLLRILFIVVFITIRALIPPKVQHALAQNTAQVATGIRSGLDLPPKNRPVPAYDGGDIGGVDIIETYSRSIGSDLIPVIAKV
jgi:hypothetical protein